MVIQLAMTGILVALLPLSIVWGSNDSDKYRKLILLTLFLTFDLILFGAFTRLSDSGLGCPDWPGCYGHASPWQAHADISAAQLALPSGPVTVMKAWIEMTHRYFAMGIGVLIIALMVIAWRRWLQSGRVEKRFSPFLPTFLFVLVCVQGAFGAWTVTQKLQPLIVTIHLLLGLSLLALLACLLAQQNRYVADALPVSNSAAVSALKIPAACAFLVLIAQVALGAWVSTNYATLACTDFPLCHGNWIPSMDFANAYTLWRELGKTGSGEYLPFAALTAIHWVHRTFAVVVIALIAWVAYRARRIDGLNRIARFLFVVLAVQFGTGVLSIFFMSPLLLAAAHNGGAALLTLLLTMLNCKIRMAPLVGISQTSRTSQ